MLVTDPEHKASCRRNGQLKLESQSNTSLGQCDICRCGPHNWRRRMSTRGDWVTSGGITFAVPHALSGQIRQICLGDAIGLTAARLRSSAQRSCLQ